MIDWPNLCPALIELFSRLGVDSGSTFRAEHADRPRMLMDTTEKRTLTMQVVSAIPIGVDEERTGTDDDGAAFRLVCGQRVLSLRLKCDAIENADDTWAWTTISRIQTRLRRSDSIAALDAVEAAVNEIGSAYEANFRHSGRIHSRVLLDLKLNVAVNDLDESPIDFIERVVWSSHAEDIDGEYLPAPPNVVNETTPPAP